MERRIAIVGGGIAGLVASYVLRGRGYNPDVYEPGEPGAAFLAGGLKYLAHTKAVAAMLDDLGVVSDEYVVKGGILLHGSVHPFPRVFRSMPADRAERIRCDHYRKTRGTSPDRFAARAMNDPEARPGTRRALRCDLEDVVARLAKRAVIVPRAVSTLVHRPEGGAAVQLRSGAAVPYDVVIVTIPLWITKLIASWEVPDVTAMKLNIARVVPKRDPFAKWDYVYTPYTQENLVHRVSPAEDGYDVEFNGGWNPDVEQRLRAECWHLFNAGFGVSWIRTGLNGHLLPPEDPIVWPSGVYPLGRFSQWDPRATTEVVMDGARKIVDEIPRTL